jgi:sestrin
VPIPISVLTLTAGPVSETTSKQRPRQQRLLPSNILTANKSDPVVENKESSTENMGQIGHSENQMMFIDAFLQNNRLDHVTQVMSYHPQYLECFMRTQNFMLRGDGPLPYDYRHYIAIMAAGRHQCSYLVNQQKQEFLLQGGCELWLKGLEYIPQKLRDLYDMNKILAHRPWLLSGAHIEKLTKGKDNWSISELVHAIVLLAHFHALSSFVFGCGIGTEDNLDDGITNQNYPCKALVPVVARSVSPPSAVADAGSIAQRRLSLSDSDSEVGGVEALMQRMKTLSENAQQETSIEEKVKRFEKVEIQSAEIAAVLQLSTKPKADISAFIEDAGFVYHDFAKRGEVSDIATFRVQDYSWDDHGFCLVNRLYNDVGMLLDEKFKTAYNLTYYTMGTKKDVDTSMFRRAIWNYIHCMFGIRHDDYDYGEVNQLLERDLKAYIKTVCCFPERTTKKNYDSIMRDFMHSEKVHVNLMTLEARMQAELLYALRAIMRYMT